MTEVAEKPKPKKKPKPTVSSAGEPVIGYRSFDDWCIDAKPASHDRPADRCVYHIGHLALDREKRLWVDRVASAALRGAGYARKDGRPVYDAKARFLCLTQRRVGGVFEYIATRVAM